jgi:hypothetical protein
MTRTPNENGQSQDKVGLTTVVLGIDENGKAKGARFSAEQRQHASQAAQSLKLQVYDVSTEQLKDVLKKLPTGRIYAKGRAFVPFIKRELYDQVIAVSAGEYRNVPRSLSSAASPPDSQSQFPASWEEIAPGHVVLAPEGPANGWWEVIVLSRDGRTLTLKYRDYPKLPKRVLDIHEVALVHPGPE